MGEGLLHGKAGLPGVNILLFKGNRKTTAPGLVTGLLRNSRDI